MDDTLSTKDLLVISSAVVILLVGSMLIRFSTALGPWTMVDTVDYFDVARNQSRGNGLVLTRASGLGNPMTIHPPFYSIVLTPAVIFDLNLLHFVRMLNIILFAALVLIICLGTYRLTHSALLSIGLGLWTVTNRAILRNYTAALSEPLFLTIGFTSLYLICEYIKTKKHWLMFASALLAGLALLTRYSGVAFLVTGFFTILIWLKADWSVKIKDLASYMILASAPILLWVEYLRIYFPGNMPGSYEGVTNIWQAMSPFRLTLVEGLWEWLGLRLLFFTQEYRAKIFILAILGITLGLVTIRAIRVSAREKTDGLSESPLLWGNIWVIFTIASAAMLLFSYLFVESPKPWLDERLYSPIQIGIVFSIILIVNLCASKLIRGAFRHVPSLALIALMVIANTPAMITYAQRLHVRGEGYTSRAWSKSTVIDALQNIPPDKMIISNDPGAILFFTGKPAIDLASIIRQTEYNEIPATLQERGVAVVIFERKLTSQLRHIYGDEVDLYIEKLTSSLQTQFKGNNGTIYYSP
jgi:hypothetical protein